RASNVYGDPATWSHQPTALFTVLSFLNTTKYPVSLLFLLMTLGPMMLALAWLERPAASSPAATAQGALRRVLCTFGRVPLFFYLLQWYTAHVLALLAGLVAGQHVSWQFMTGHKGFSLWVVYACWVIGVVALYPLCRWFARVKARRNEWWLSYL